MSNYCECCTTNTEHIRQHYDRYAETTPNEAPELVLAMFQACCDPENPCTVNIQDVVEYINELKAEAAAKLADR